MGRLLVFILALGVLAGVAAWQVRGGAGKSAPKQTLDKVHDAADRVERDMKDKAAAAEKSVE